jgi:Spy/CpxP family protein refolding chaperone
MLATTAMAQGQEGQGRRGGGRGGAGGFMMSTGFLVGVEQVQKELKVTDEQKEKLTALREEGGGQRRGQGGGGGEGGNRRGRGEAPSEEQMAEFRKRSEEQNKKVEAILTADQNKRLKEIVLQTRGAGALRDEQVAKSLGLTEDQVAALKTIGEESDKRMGEIRQSGGDDREARQKKMEELRADTEAESLAVLSDEQKTKFTEMKGAKFELDRRAMFGGGGGNRRRGGNNN